MDGTGYIGVGERRSEIADPAEVARAYLEFHFVGGVVAQQVAELPERLTRLWLVRLMSMP